MRYYVITPAELGDGERHILAEVVREDHGVDADRSITMAAGVAGVAASVLTRDELLATPGGPLALAAWERDDDQEFDDETIRLAARDIIPALSLVGKVVKVRDVG